MIRIFILDVPRAESRTDPFKGRFHIGCQAFMGPLNQHRPSKGLAMTQFVK